jgi:hypothetical protein
MPKHRIQFALLGKQLIFLFNLEIEFLLCDEPGPNYTGSMTASCMKFVQLQLQLLQLLPTVLDSINYVVISPG